MRIYRFWILTGILTFFALIAIWFQLQTYRLGYLITQKEKRYEEIKEQNSLLALEVEELKKPEILMAKALEFKLGLTVPSEIRVVKVKLPSRESIEKNRLYFFSVFSEK